MLCGESEQVTEHAVLWLMSEFCAGLMECKVAGLTCQDDLQIRSVF